MMENMHKLKANDLLNDKQNAEEELENAFKCLAFKVKQNVLKS